MPTNYRIAFGCYLAAIAVLMLIGVIYFLSDEFMPYHAQAVGTTWKELPANFRLLFLAFLNGSGAAMIALSTIIGFVLFLPFREQKRWTEWAIPLTGLMLCLPLLYIVAIIKLKTNAATPLSLALIINILFVSGFIATKFTYIKQYLTKRTILPTASSALKNMVAETSSITD